MGEDTNGLIEFLLARIAEDEDAARLCAEMFPSPWDVADRGWRVRIYASGVPEENFFSDDPAAKTERYPVVMEVEPDRNIEDPRWLSERVEHVRRHDPARVLAECEAKRRIVARHDRDDSTSFGQPCQTLRLLALPYADHSDYRPEWHPDA